MQCDLCGRTYQRPSTWLFSNHYKRTINYEALFDRRLYENRTTNACLCGLGKGMCTKQPGPKQVLVFGKEASHHKPIHLLSVFVFTAYLALITLGGDEKQNKKFHISTKKRAGVHNQMCDTWPGGSAAVRDAVRVLALFWLRKHLVTWHQLYSAFPSTPPSFFLLLSPHQMKLGNYLDTLYIMIQSSLKAYYNTKPNPCAGTIRKGKEKLGHFEISNIINAINCFSLVKIALETF